MILSNFLQTRFALLLPALVLFSGLVSAQVPPEVAQDMMRKSGMWEPFSSVAAQIKAGFNETARAPANKDTRELTPEQNAHIDAIIDKAYEASKLRALAQDILAEKLPAQHLSSLQAWFNSPLGTTISALEVAISTSTRDGADITKEGTERFRKASAQRQVLLKNVSQVSRAAEASVDMIINTSLGIYRGFALANPHLAGSSLEQKEAELLSRRARMIRAYQPAALAILTLTYESLNDQQLRDYLSFLASEAGTSFNNLSIETTDTVLRKAAEELGLELTRTRPGTST